MAKGLSRVLIVEDEKPLRDVYALILEQEGYKVDTAENGQVAIKKLRAFKPNLVILDMLMPVMDGMGFLKSAKMIERFPEIKTIVVSNLSNSIEKADKQKYGVVDTFVKVNLSPSDLAKIVKKYT